MEALSERKDFKEVKIMRKSFKKIVAVAMAATMVLGSNVVAFADDANSATGTGTNTGHLDTNVVIAVLPTTTDVNGVFNFTIDPENILATADKFTDGTTAAGADFKNSDLVYFKQANGAEKAYASSSQTVSVKAKNYVAADVSVAATVADAADGKTTIPLVADADALSAATTPSLLLTLKVGTKTAAITADGATVSDTIAAQDGKFDVKRQADGSYKVDPQTGDSITWDGVNVQLTGKVKGGDVDSTIAAPNVTLTWTVAAHVDGTAVSGVSASGTSDILVRLVSGVNANASKITSVTVNGTSVASSNIAVSGSGNVWLKSVVTESVDTYSIVIVYDGTTYIGSYTK